MSVSCCTLVLRVDKLKRLAENESLAIKVLDFPGRRGPWLKNCLGREHRTDKGGGSCEHCQRYDTSRFRVQCPRWFDYPPPLQRIISTGIRDADMTIKIIFERSSQKGGRQGVRKEGQQGPTLKFYCRPKAQEKQHFGKSHFYCRRFFPGNTVTIILDNYPPSTLQGVGLGGRKNARIIVGENSCHFGAS